jgi:hypothetical protein
VGIVNAEAAESRNKTSIMVVVGIALAGLIFQTYFKERILKENPT